MRPVYIALLLFLAVVLYKALLNVVRYRQIIHLQDLYNTAMLSDDRVSFNVYIPKLVGLFKAAGLKDSKQPYVSPLGLGYVATQHASLFDNIAVLDEQFVLTTLRYFDLAQGIFKDRAIEAFNPLYWIQFFIFLPRNIISYLGLKSDAIFVRFLQLAWWFALPFAVFFRDRLFDFVKDVFK